MAVELPGTLIRSGRSADVCDIGGGRVLRRHRDGREAWRVETRATLAVSYWPTLAAAAVKAGR